MNKESGMDKVFLEEEIAPITFNSEITLLTVRQKLGQTIFCPPIGHIQSEGDYVESWQPCDINENLLKDAQKISKVI